MAEPCTGLLILSLLVAIVISPCQKAAADNQWSLHHLGASNSDFFVDLRGYITGALDGAGDSGTAARRIWVRSTE